MNHTMIAVTAMTLGLSVAGCRDRETKPIERPVMPSPETGTTTAPVDPS